MQQFSNSMRIVSFVLLVSVTWALTDTGTATATATAPETATASATAPETASATSSHASNYQTATELNFNIDAYECDDENNRLDYKHRHRREMGSVYRFCIEPNDVAKEAGVGIKQLESWEWRMGFDDDIVQECVVEGKSNALSVWNCLDGGTLCVVESLLKTGFYEWDDTVRGYGALSFTAGMGSVPITFNLFLRKLTFDFKVVTHDDGTVELVKGHSVEIFDEDDDEETTLEPGTEGDEHDESVQDGGGDPENDEL